MKKALVLGVLAFFAINIASVQSASAQDRKETTTVKKEAKPSGVKKEAKQTAKTATTSTTATAAEKKTVKPAAASWDQEKKDGKSCCKEDGKKECQAPKTGSKAVDPTAKNKKATPEIGVPPTPQNSGNKGTAKTTSTGSTSGQR